MKATPRKGLHDLHTMSRRVSDAEKPQRRYIRMAILELEKVRRGKEKNRACRRIEEIDGRLAQIAAEQAQLLTQLPPETTPRSAARQAGFTLNY
jgi:hypothetical protein